MKTIIVTNVPALPSYAFECMTEIQTVKLPDTLELMSCDAFNTCEKLKDLIIPASVKEFVSGRYFNRCAALTDVYYMGTPEEWSNVDATGHSWGEWEVVQEPTATESGLRQRTCARCGETEQEEIPRLGITYGDVNGDGKVNTLDLVILRQFLAGWDVRPDPDAADVNGDGKVSTLDLVILRQHLAGWDVTLGPKT